MGSTKQLAKYIDEIGVNLAKLSKKSGVPYPALYASLCGDGKRELRADELIKICVVLQKNPMDFMSTEDNENEKKD